MSLIRSSGSDPSPQSFHRPSSRMHLVFLFNLTVQLVLMPSLALRVTLSLSMFIPYAPSSLLEQSFSFSKSMPYSSAHFSMRSLLGIC